MAGIISLLRDSKMEGGLGGLVIVFSAFMVQVLAFGNYACVGIYTVHLLEEFEGDAVGVSLISSIHFAVLLGFGPVTSFLMGLLSARKLCLAGAALVSLGIFCTPLLVLLPTMYIFFGVFAGLGGCLIYLPSHVLSGLYYDKYRSLAVGVATAGQGMAAILMPPVVGLLIEAFTWRGSLIILAGIDLHLFIFALLMVPPPDTKTAEQLTKLAQEQENSLVDDTQDTDDSVFIPDDSVFIPDGAGSKPSRTPRDKFLFDKVDVKHSYQPSWQARAGEESRCALVECPATPKSPARQRLSSSSSVTTPRLERRPSKRMSAYLEGKIHRRQIPDDDISNIFIPSYYSWLPGYHGNGVGSTAIREDSQDNYRSNYRAEFDNVQSEDEAKSLVVHDAKSSSPDNAAVVKPRTAKEELKKHIHILLDFDFIIYFISTLLWSMTTTLFLTFGPDFFVLQGHSDIDSAFVFTFYGVGQFFGCIFVSILGSFIGRKRMLLFIFANVFTGLLMGVVPFFSSFTEIAAMLCGLGLMYGGILGLYMIVMVDIIGTDDMDIGLGYIMLGSGIGCFTGPPIGGSLIILAGIDLHLFIFALLMVPPPDTKTAEQLTKLAQEQENSLVDDTQDTDDSVFIPDDSVFIPDGAGSKPSRTPRDKFLFDKVDVKHSYQPSWQARAGEESRCALVECPATPKSPARQRLSSSSSVTTPRLERRPSKRMSAYLEGKIHRRQIPDDDISNIFIPSYYSWLPGYHGNGVGSTAIREDSQDNYRSNYRAEFDNVQSEDEAKSLVVHDAKSSSPDNAAVVKPRTAKEELKKHIHILLDFDFIIYFISTLLWSMTTTLFLTFGPDFFVLQGHSDIDSAFVFTFYGVGQFFGCIFVSILGSFIGRKRMLLFIFANVFTGLLMGVVPFFSSFTEIAAMLCGLGLMYGGILGLYMIVMVDIIGTDDMDIGLGYIMLGSGIGCFTGPPIGGAMLKVYGNYDLAFYLSGLITILAGLIMVLVYRPGKCKKGEPP